MLVALSCLLVLLSTTVVWAHRTVLNTDTFVGTVAPVFKDPAVTSAVAARATDELFAELNLQARLRAALPPKASFAAVPITNATKGFVAGELTKVLASPRVPGRLDRDADHYAPAVGGGVARPEHGGCLHLGRLYRPQHVPVINQALGKVSGLASELTGKHVTLPDHHQRRSAAAAGGQAVQGSGSPAAQQLRRDHPGPVQRPGHRTAGVKAFDGLTLVLPLVTIALIALCLWLSVNRRRTVLQLAVGVSLLMIVERRVVLHEQSVLAGAAHNPQLASTVLGDLLHGFFVLTAWVLGVALVVLVIAVLCRAVPVGGGHPLVGAAGLARHRGGKGR